GAPADPAQVAQDLGVESVLDGTYQRTPGVVRVSVQLINGRDRAMRWAERYDLRAADMLTFQDEIAKKVVDGLSVQVSNRENAAITAPATSSPEAYNLYLQARFYQNDYSMRSTLESLHRGQELARKATEKDSSFVEAHALLAILYALEAANFQVNSGANLALAEKEARRAVELNGTSSDALAALGMALTIEGR